eukprot:SAG22_NODE_1095_length_5580_cov_3.745302_4_plen_709_part_00
MQQLSASGTVPIGRARTFSDPAALFWSLQYSLADVPKDIVAGCTVGVLAVPQAMSYATVAGLPPVYGLYNAFVGLLPYPIFGTSPALISGPTAVMSILVGSVVPATIHGQPVHPCISDGIPAGHSEADTCPERIGLCLVLAMLAGILQLIMGVCRLGFLVDLISEPVITGFTSGAAFLIAATQFSNMFGIQKCTHLQADSAGVLRSSSWCKHHGTYENTTMLGDDGSWSPHVGKFTSDCHNLYHGECLFHEQLYAVYLQFHHISWPTVLFGACCFALLYVFQFPLKKVLPAKAKLFANMGPLIVVVVSLIIVQNMGVDKKVAKTVANTGGALGIRIVGTICEESGFACLPKPAWPFSIKFCEEESKLTPQMFGTCKSDGAAGHTEGITFSDIPVLLGPAVIVALIGYMESMTIAKTVQKQRAKQDAAANGNFKMEMDPSQELFALGMCNVAVSICSGYPVTGSFSRTAVNGNSGARSPFACMTCAVVVGGALVLLTHQLQFMPKVVLAAIVMISIVKFVDIEEAIYLWRISKPDFLVFALMFLSTIFLGVQPALLIGILSNWALYLTSGNRAHVALLACEPGQQEFRDIKSLSDDKKVGTMIAVVKLFGDLTFANASAFRTTIDDVRVGLPTAAIVVDCSNVNAVDRSGIHILHTVANDLVDDGIRLVIADLPRHCRKVLERAAKHDGTRANSPLASFPLPPVGSTTC